jgi:PA14 domain/Chitobiase/beta-hexosaminidase C-terminal domain/Calcineurin-like phosphoesterase
MRKSLQTLFQNTVLGLCLTLVIFCGDTEVFGQNPTKSLKSDLIKTKYFESDVTTELKPWTNLKFYNNPKNFQFAIISDNSGGSRPGVFADGIKKLNLLMPEFVMSVGDFIQGNTNDRSVLKREWAEIDKMIKPLKVPLFFIPGNHDINNDVMREFWNNRSGVASYSFVYKDVLFLALDTTGEKGQIIPDYQIESMKKALAKHATVRWTFVFMHHPLWLYKNPAGFAKIEPLLKGRPHTVFAGHTHHYLHENRDGANYYILGTTGGGSRLRGRKFGEFDHVTWVTISDTGPVIANLKLDGILPHNATTRDDYKVTRALTSATNLPFITLTNDEKMVSSANVYLKIRNPSEHALEVKAQFNHGHQVKMNPVNITRILSPRSEEVVKVDIKIDEAVSTKNPVLLKLNWTMGYKLKDEADLFLTGTRNIPLTPSSAPLIATVAPEFVGSVLIVPGEKKEGHTIRFTTDGSTPTINSKLFDKPITINKETTVKARRFNERGNGTATSVRVYKPVPAGTGLSYHYYEGEWIRMPDFSKLKPKFSSVTSSLNMESLQMRIDDWAMVLEGNYKLDKEGEYTFHLNSDDGSLLYIDDELVVNNDGGHSAVEISGKKTLTAGSHRIRLEFFETLGAAILELEVEGPGMPRQPIQFDRLSH